jgi:hyperosmotically inducible periplasmic protein
MKISPQHKSAVTRLCSLQSTLSRAGLGITFLVVGAFTSFAAEEPNLLERVVDELSAQAGLGANDVVVQIRRSTVWLEGQVGSLETKNQVERIVSEVSGVKTVVSSLTIDPSMAKLLGKHEGSALADVILEEMKQRKLQNYAVSVSSHRGVVTLSGNVGNQKTIEEIEEITLSTSGVHRVINKLVVKEFPEPVAPKIAATDAELYDRLKAALQNEELIKSQSIKFEVEKGIASFSGRAPTHSDSDQILSIALMVDGIKDVKSSIKVRPK